jgi:hypothetical protein
MINKAAAHRRSSHSFEDPGWTPQMSLLTVAYLRTHTCVGESGELAPCKFAETQRRLKAPQSLCNCCCQKNSQRCANLTRRVRRQLHRPGSPGVAPPGLRRAASWPAAQLSGAQFRKWQVAGLWEERVAVNPGAVP